MENSRPVARTERWRIEERHAAALRHALSPTEVVDVTMDSVSRALPGADVALRVHVGIDPTDLEEATWLVRGEVAPEIFDASANRLTLANESCAFVWEPARLGDRPIGPTMIAGLVRNGREPGILVARRDSGFDEEELQMLGRMAEIAAWALRHQRLRGMLWELAQVAAGAESLVLQGHDLAKSLSFIRLALARVVSRLPKDVELEADFSYVRDELNALEGPLRSIVERASRTAKDWLGVRSSLRCLVADAADRVERRHRCRPVEVELSEKIGSIEVPQVCGAIIENLLDNAVQACRDRKRVGLTVVAWGEWAWIRVIDEGSHCCGAVLPGSDRVAEGTEYDGIGAGLRLSRAVAHSVGGEIWLERRKDGGMEARLELPLVHAGP